MTLDELKNMNTKCSIKSKSSVGKLNGLTNKYISKLDSERSYSSKDIEEIIHAYEKDISAVVLKQDEMYDAYTKQEKLLKDVLSNTRNIKEQLTSEILDDINNMSRKYGKGRIYGTLPKVVPIKTSVPIIRSAAISFPEISSEDTEWTFVFK